MKKPTELQKLKVKGLARKNFIESKVREIILGIFILIGVILIPYLIVAILDPDCSEVIIDKGSCVSFDYWFYGFVVLVMLTMISLLLYFVISFWIKDNWSDAYKKAEEEIGVDSSSFNYEQFKEEYK